MRSLYSFRVLLLRSVRAVWDTLAINESQIQYKYNGHHKYQLCRHSSYVSDWLFIGDKILHGCMHAHNTTYTSIPTLLVSSVSCRSVGSQLAHLARFVDHLHVPGSAMVNAYPISIATATANLHAC